MGEVLSFAGGAVRRDARRGDTPTAITRSAVGNPAAAQRCDPGHLPDSDLCPSLAVPSAQLLHLLRRPDAKLRPPRHLCGANRRPQRWPAASDWTSWLACGPTIGKSWS